MLCVKAFEHKLQTSYFWQQSISRVYSYSSWQIIVKQVANSINERGKKSNAIWNNESRWSWAHLNQPINRGDLFVADSWGNLFTSTSRKVSSIALLFLSGDSTFQTFKLFLQIKKRKEFLNTIHFTKETRWTTRKQSLLVHRFNATILQRY